MGLDMYLTGRKKGEKRDEEGEFPTSGEDLGYWRKHPDLHGYIVKTFAGGVDECQDIPLSAVDLHKVLEAVKTDALPSTKGFFFGQSNGPNDQETSAKIAKAITWLSSNDDRVVFYRASW